MLSREELLGLYHAVSVMARDLDRLVETHRPVAGDVRSRAALGELERLRREVARSAGLLSRLLGQYDREVREAVAGGLTGLMALQRRFESGRKGGETGRARTKRARSKTKARR